MSAPSKLRPLFILGAALVVVAALMLMRQEPEDRPQQDSSPLVRVAAATPSDYRFTVKANGAVQPQTESELIPQVSGEIVEMSPSLVSGGFFQAGELLARIDAADYRVDREAARAQVARAKSEFARADKELKRQKQLAGRSVASESRIDDAENAYRIAEASLREAEARLERAARDLSRTEIRAPYRGRVRSEQVDLGQFVNRGNSIAKIYAVDFAEVRLPVPDRELAYLDFDQLRASNDSNSEIEGGGARVLFRAEFAGLVREWEGYLVRTEAELDPRSRMINLVARVADPLGLEMPREAPLSIGLFVDAEIEGYLRPGVFVLPRDALRPNDELYVVDSEGKLHFRPVEVLRTERDRIVVGKGLEPGDRVCTSPLEAAIDGMLVRIADESQPPPAEVIAAPTPADGQADGIADLGSQSPNASEPSTSAAGATIQ